MRASIRAIHESIPKTKSYNGISKPNPSNPQNLRLELTGEDAIREISAIRDQKEL